MTKEAPELANVLRKLGARIRERREGLGQTQKECADLSSMSWKRWQGIEYGDVNVTISTLLRIAYALRTGINDLLPQSQSLNDYADFLRDGELNSDVVVELTAEGRDVAKDGALAATVPELREDGGLSAEACCVWILEQLQRQGPLRLHDIYKQYRQHIQQGSVERGMGFGFIAEAVEIGCERGYLSPREEQ